MAEVVDPLRLAWSRRRGRWRLTLGILLLLVLPVGAYLLGRGSQTPQEVFVDRSRVETPTVTVAVERRSVTEQAVEFLGEVLIEPETLLSRAEGVVISTLQAGTAISEGDVLAVINDRPVFVLQGDLPLLEPLLPGSSGSHVVQLQEALARLGLYTIAVDGDFGPKTAAALRRLYTDNGFAVPFTEIEPEPEPEPATAPTTTLASGSGDPADPAVITPAAAPAPAQPVKPRKETTARPAEILFVPELPVRVLEPLVQRGSVLAEGDGLATVSGSQPFIEALLAASLPWSLTPGTEVLLADSPSSAGTAETELRTATIGSVTEQESDGQPTGFLVVRVVGGSALSLDDVGSSLWIRVPSLSRSLENALVVPSSAVYYDAAGSPYVLAERDGEAVPTELGIVDELSGWIALDESQSQVSEGTVLILDRQE